jgi:telomere length regulation protein
LAVFDRLSGDYGIEEVYWAVWAGNDDQEKGRSAAEELNWEEAARSVVSIPAKAANAVGRWKSENWSGELPDGLMAK